MRYMFQWCFKTLLSVVILNKILMHRQCSIRDFPGGSIVKNPLANAGDMGSTPGSGISPGEGNTPVFLPGKFHGERSLVGYTPCGLMKSMLCYLTKIQTKKSPFPF